ncbi:hypothetical protein PAL_GLEAN10005307 [Pteropus alecto]|uniref:Uncharacterized protein n=1 Tax=Pteropus alecto TaxID=9402 RepID=L5JTG1_PTEAL|nr:hypothetical protein PAL_GLEAN10005307 [Pteropus alecto]
MPRSYLPFQAGGPFEDTRPHPFLPALITTGTSRPQSCPEASSELGMYQLFWRPQAKVSTSVPSGAGEVTPGQAGSSQLLEHPESDGLTRSRNPIS